MIDWTILGVLIPMLAFTPAAPKAPPPPPPPPSKTDAEIQAEKAATMAAIRKRRGRASTILAGEQKGALAPAAPVPGATTLG